jgi:adenylate cyclase
MWKMLSVYIFGEAAPDKLPERVRRSIARQQAQSEQLISWVQLLLVVIFATLYAIAPKTGAHAPFQPVPWALGLYFAFTVMRLLFSLRRALPEWILMISLVMDMGLLMVLIWSFHIQYMQPPSFYLKAPTLIYVFIFIALRALRFDPRHIILAGLAAVAGWVILVLYVVFSEAGNPMITRNFVTYMTSNAVLIGAEVDKVISITLVTLILAAAIARAKRVFERDMFDSMAAADLSRFVSPEVAHRITHADKKIAGGDAEIREVSILFTDIEGFSTLSEQLEPVELSRILNDFFQTLSEIATRCGGVITQYQGDMILVTFNAVTPNAHHAQNAVTTALAIQEMLKNRTFGHGVRLKARCGINSGKVAIGAMGAQDRLVFTVLGDEVNVASRLEALNKDYGSHILAGENTVRLCDGAFDFTKIDSLQLRGRESKTTIYTPEPD